MLDSGFEDNFKAILGQDRAIAELKERITQGTLIGSFLFHGPAGVGKYTCARALAQTVLAPYTATHPDMVKVEPDEKNRIRIDQARELIRRMGLQAVRATQKIAIINDSDTLTPEAGNALLKLVEEPGNKNCIILISAAAGAVLPTLKSRCQAIAFQPLPHDVIQTLLERQGQWSDEIIRRVVPVAGGSLTQAERFAQWLSDLDTSLPDLFQELATHPYHDLVDRFTTLPTDAPGIVALLEGLRVVCRDLMVMQEAGSSAAQSILFESHLPVMQQLVTRFDREGLIQSHDAINQAQAALRQNTQATLLWEALAFRIQSCQQS